MILKTSHVLRGLECCVKEAVCSECPYTGRKKCMDRLIHDALLLLATRDEERTPCGTNAAGAQRAPVPLGSPGPWTREGILDRARDCVCGQREQDYGSPEDNFGRIAALWTAYMDVEITPVDVARMMALLKIARLHENDTHIDSWVDLAGYAACGGEIAAKGLNL